MSYLSLSLSQPESLLLRQSSSVDQASPETSQKQLLNSVLEMGPLQDDSTSARQDWQARFPYEPKTRLSASARGAKTARVRVKEASILGDDQGELAAKDCVNVELLGVLVCVLSMLALIRMTGLSYYTCSKRALALS